MDKHNNLNVALLTNKCNEAIHNLNQDIEDNEMVLTNLQNIVAEERLSGEAISAFKNMLADYYAVTQLNIQADESDIADINTILANLSESLYGDVIFPAHDKAQADRDEYRRLAREQRRNSQYFNPAVIPYASEGTTPIENPYETNAKKLDSLADGCEIERLKWENKMKLYDQIESNTAGLFQNGKAIRDVIKGMLEAMNKQSISGNYNQMAGTIELKYNLDIDDPDLRKLINDVIPLENLTQQEIDALMEKYPEIQELIEQREDILKLEKRIENENSAAAKAQMEIELKRWLNKEEELMTQILSKTNHSMNYGYAFSYLCERNASSEIKRNLFDYWLLVDEKDDLMGMELPPLYLSQLEKEIDSLNWKYVDNPTAATYRFYEGDASLYLMLVAQIKDGIGLDDDVKNNYLNDRLFNLIICDNSYSGNSVPFKERMRIYGEVLGIIWDQKDEAGIATLAILLSLFPDMSNVGVLGFSGVTNNSAILKTISSAEWRIAGNNILKAFGQLSSEDMNKIYNILGDASMNTMDVDMINKHYKTNCSAWETFVDSTNPLVHKRIYDDKIFIENQHDLVKSLLGQNMLYGKTIPYASENWFMSGKTEGNSLMATGNCCEIVAYYNVRTALEGKQINFADCIRDFEEKAPAVAGNWGTCPDHIQEKLEIDGYNTTSYDISGMNTDDFGKMLEENDAFIITEWNDEEADGMIHTMAITVETEEVDPNTHETHKYLVRHNDFKNQNGFTRVEYTPENLEKLMTEYRDGSVHGNDGIKITGVSRE